MPKISFTKMVASGNDFVVIERSQNPTINSPGILARRICDRKFGVGADGLLLLEKSKIANVKMRIFNPDGSEAEMCGNGTRCVALYSSKLKTQNSKLKIETKAGIINAEVNKNTVKIKLTDPKGLKLNIPLKISNRSSWVSFINTGVPHAVVFVGDIDLIDFDSLGRQVRNHKFFAPKGTNVNFVDSISSDFDASKDYIEIRTYERGVEGETLACGTGAVASALIMVCDYKLEARKINVLTKSGEILKVYFDKVGDNFKNVWLEGKARIVYQGVYYV